LDRERQSTGRGQLKEYTIERRFKQPARSIIHCGSFYLFENGLSENRLFEDGLHALARVVVTPEEVRRIRRSNRIIPDGLSRSRHP
jgi:hypothetical protein